MSFKSPKTSPNSKAIASAAYPFLFGVLLNETNPERAITQILERIYKKGRVSKRLTDSTPGRSLSEFVFALSKHPKVKGFDSEEGRTILAGWLQSTLVEMGNTKRGGGGASAIDYIRPLSAAAYRAGFPRQKQRHRGSDLFVYRSMLEYVADMSSDSRNDLAAALKEALIARTSLGAGIDTRMHPPYRNPQYDEKTILDVNALLLLRMVESVEGLAEQTNETNVEAPISFPIAFAGQAIGKDFFEFATNFTERTTGELVEALVSLTAFRLFQLPIATSIGVSEVLRPAAGPDGNVGFRNLEMYVDFTGGDSPVSAEISRECVRRDFRRLRQLFADGMRLRTIEQAASSDNSLSLELNQLDGPRKLQRLVELQDEPRIEATLGIRLFELEQECRDVDADQVDAILETRRRFATHLDIFTDLVLQDREKEGVEGIRKWMYSTGGLIGTMESNYYACLSGTKKAPTTWKYELSDSLFRTILDLCFLNEKGKVSNSPLPMSKLLQRLRDRFGILVDTAPSESRDPLTSKASSDNFIAFVAKLKVMGYFRGLSDDFTAQFVERPDIKGKK